VDFAYEVSRSLYACDGVLLLVDACQGVQAQTVSNFMLALNSDLTIIPVLNKIDMDHADPDKAMEQMVSLLGMKHGEEIRVSAKTGLNCDQIFCGLISQVPSPQLQEEPEGSGGGASGVGKSMAEVNKELRSLPLKMLLFDSWYDEFRGVMCTMLVHNGVIKAGTVIQSVATGEKCVNVDLGTQPED
jgi:translation elongation factor EF-4